MINKFNRKKILILVLVLLFICFIIINYIIINYRDKYIKDYKENHINKIIHNKPMIDVIYSIYGSCINDDNSCIRKKVDINNNFLSNKEDRIDFINKYIYFNRKNIKTIKNIKNDIYIDSNTYNNYYYKFFGESLDNNLINKIIDKDKSNYIRIDKVKLDEEANYTFVNSKNEKYNNDYVATIDIIDINKVDKKNRYKTKSLADTTLVNKYTSSMVVNKIYLKYNKDNSNNYKIISISLVK